MKSIIVTGIGGVVGQGILRNLRAMDLDECIIGLNTEQVSAGNHLCDYVYKVPYAYDKGYIDAVSELAQQHEVQLIIPSTDYETYYLSLYQSVFQCAIAVSPPEIAAICLDKYSNYKEFEKIGLPFAKSMLPSKYKGDFQKTIVKPREGRGSRNIHIDPISPTIFGDDYVVQEYLEGEELTTTFYVTKARKLHGFITLKRELEQGSTSRCDVVFNYDALLSEIIGRIISHFPLRGSCNIQSRVTSAGIIPFEINCRISGTNSIRSQFGFNDVAYTVQELLFGREPDIPSVKKGSAIRIIHDVIYPNISLGEITNRNDDFWIF